MVRKLELEKKEGNIERNGKFKMEWKSVKKLKRD